MSQLNGLQAVKTVIVHDNCGDGMMSALLLHDALPEAEIRFVQYGATAHKDLKPESGMLFCDFSPHPDRFQEFIDAGAIILDHHKTAKGIVEAAGVNGVFGDESTQPGVCGAVLAFREVWLRLAPPYAVEEGYEQAKQMAELAGVYDTWVTASPRWQEARELTQALKFFPAESWLAQPKPFSSASLPWWKSRLETGHWLVQKHDKKVAKAIEGAHRFTTPKGTRVVMFSGSTLSSDAAETLEQTADLVVGFDYYEVQNEIATLGFSTRSHTHYDCAALCKYYGGGGHTKAAGFSVKFSLDSTCADPYSLFHTRLEAYEF